MQDRLLHLAGEQQLGVDLVLHGLLVPGRPLGAPHPAPLAPPRTRRRVGRIVDRPADPRSGHERVEQEQLPVARAVVLRVHPGHAVAPRRVALPRRAALRQVLCGGLVPQPAVAPGPHHCLVARARGHS